MKLGHSHRKAMLFRGSERQLAAVPRNLQFQGQALAPFLFEIKVPLHVCKEAAQRL